MRVASAAGSETRAPGALGLGGRGWVRRGMNGQDLQDGLNYRIGMGEGGVVGGWLVLRVRRAVILGCWGFWHGLWAGGGRLL